MESMEKGKHSLVPEWEKEKLFPTVTVYNIIEMKSIFIVLIGDWGDICRCCHPSNCPDRTFQVLSVFVVAYASNDEQ
jgi:hypothetical protein